MHLQVFDILLNGEHVIVDQLDIYNEVGRGVAHDEVIPFTVKNKQLHVLDQKSYIENSRVRVDFIKVRVTSYLLQFNLSYVKLITRIVLCKYMHKTFYA